MIDCAWASRMESLGAESLRRYRESHQEAMTEQFVHEEQMLRSGY